MFIYTLYIMYVCMYVCMYRKSLSADNLRKLVLCVCVCAWSFSYTDTFYFLFCRPYPGWRPVLVLNVFANSSLCVCVCVYVWG